MMMLLRMMMVLRMMMTMVMRMMMLLRTMMLSRTRMTTVVVDILGDTGWFSVRVNYTSLSTLDV